MISAPYLASRVGAPAMLEPVAVHASDDIGAGKLHHRDVIYCVFPNLALDWATLGVGDLAARRRAAEEPKLDCAIRLVKKRCPYRPAEPASPLNTESIAA